MPQWLDSCTASQSRVFCIAKAVVLLHGYSVLQGLGVAVGGGWKPGKTAGEHDAEAQNRFAPVSLFASYLMR